MKTKIVTFGEILLRISKPGYQRLFQGHHMFGNYGGSEANAAISLAYLGDNVEYVTRVPYGEMGEAALMHLREYGLNVSQCLVADTPVQSAYGQISYLANSLAFEPHIFSNFSHRFLRNPYTIEFGDDFFLSWQ